VPYDRRCARAGGAAHLPGCRRHQRPRKRQTSAAAHRALAGAQWHSWFGRVARALVRCCVPFGGPIHAYPRAYQTMMRAAGVTGAIRSSTVAHSDVLYECEALTPATYSSVSARVLAACG